MDQREKMNVITILKIGPINIYVNFFSNIEPTPNGLQKACGPRPEPVL